MWFLYFVTVFKKSYICQKSRYLGRNRVFRPFLIFLCYNSLPATIPTSSHSSSCHRFFSPISFLSLLLCMVYQYRKSHYIMYNFDRKNRIFFQAPASIWVQKVTLEYIADFILEFEIWRLKNITDLISYWIFGKQNWHCGMKQTLSLSAKVCAEIWCFWPLTASITFFKFVCGLITT